MDPLEAVREHGLLLLADNALPSLTRLIAGGPIRRSWWGHPRGHAIFRAARALEHHADVIAIPLIAGKVTFIHRRLWPALLAAATARERWQTIGLSSGARRLLRRVDEAGELQASGPSVRELESRLLVKAREVHTDAGRHAKVVERWDAWARRAGVRRLVDVDRAKRVIEEAADALAPEEAGRSRRPLPWQAHLRSRILA